jgi:hypothetical protein
MRLCSVDCANQVLAGIALGPVMPSMRLCSVDVTVSFDLKPQLSSYAFDAAL